MRIRVLVVGSCVGLAAVLAHGQSPVPPAFKGQRGGVDRFGAADSNKDGFLTREEASVFLHRLVENFDKVDADGDGRLSREEVDRWEQQAREVARLERAAAREAEFVAADTDRDGFISRDEAAAAMSSILPRFDTLDADKNGKLSREELYAPRLRRGNPPPKQPAK